MKNFFFICLLFIGDCLLSQPPNIDSLMIVAQHQKGAEKIITLSDISYYSTFSNTNRAIDYGQKCLQAAFVHGDSLLIAEGFNALAIALFAKSNYENALISNEKALAIRLRHGDDYSIMSSYSKIGNCLQELGRFDEAIDYYLKCLSICEKNNLTGQMGQISNNIAEIFKQQSNYEESKIYYHKAIEVAIQNKDTFQLALSLINLGVTANGLNNYNEADSLYQLSYELIEGKNYLELEAGLMTNWGVVAQLKNQPKQSIYYYKKALAIYEITGEVFGLGLIYSNLGKSYTRNNQPDSALYYLQKGLDLAQETKALPRIINAYNSLTEFYRSTEKYNKAFYYDSIADGLSDSIYSIENAILIEELNTKYKTAQKENQIVQQEIAIAKGEIENEKKNFQIYFLVASALALIVILFILLHIQKIKRSQFQQKIELEKSLTQNKVQEEKLRISRDLHDNIGAQLTFIISSLDTLNYLNSEDERQKKLSTITAFTQDTMNELRASIWTLKASQLRIDDFNLKMTELINKARMACPTIEFNITTSQDQAKLNPSIVVPLFRTLQEALNNAVKHSQATQIAYSYHNKSIRITDNGVGFDLSNTKQGNGISNMKERMQETGLKFQIMSAPNKGTRIEIQLNTTNNVLPI